MGCAQSAPSLTTDPRRLGLAPDSTVIVHPSVPEPWWQEIRVVLWWAGSVRVGCELVVAAIIESVGVGVEVVLDLEVDRPDECPEHQVGGGPCRVEMHAHHTLQHPVNRGTRHGRAGPDLASSWSRSRAGSDGTPQAGQQIAQARQRADGLTVGIVINLDTMLTRRSMTLTELSEHVGITIANPATSSTTDPNRRHHPTLSPRPSEDCTTQ